MINPHPPARHPDWNPAALDDDAFGMEHLADVHDIDLTAATSPAAIRAYLAAAVKAADMKPYGAPFVAQFGHGRLKGYSAFQPIETSLISLHCYPHRRRLYTNGFSCQEFDPEDLTRVAINHFGGYEAYRSVVLRA